MIAIVLGLYVAAVLVVGFVANRQSKDTPEAYFLAGRSLGTVVLFMALFGTNATAFVLVGIPGKAYHGGIETFGLNASLCALGIPLVFWAIGSPARKMAARLDAITPAEVFTKRFDAPRLGYFLVGLFVLYTLPYMVTAVKGAAITLDGVTQGAVPQWLGGLGVTIVALSYTLLGGMRATAWTNVLQGSLFLLFMVVAFFVMSSSMGGLEAAMQKVIDHDPQLLVKPKGGALFTPQGWSSWAMVISLTVIAFPHMLVRLMSGASDNALRHVSRLYPIAMVLLWLPAVMIGVWGAAAFPGLEGKASDRIFALMATNYLPEWLAALGFVAVVAAVMSTLDAQLLTLSSMLTRDVLKRFRPIKEVQTGKVFCVLIAFAVYGLAQVWGASVFEIASIAFSGYVTLVPALFMTVRWKGFTAAGAWTSILVGNLILLLGIKGLIPLGGFLPIFWGVVLGSIAGVVVSRRSTSVAPERIARAFGVK